MGNLSSNTIVQDVLKKNNNKKRKPLNEKEINKIATKLYEFGEILEQKIAFTEGQIDKELSNVKKHGKKNKRAALGALRRKKQLEIKVERLEDTLSVIELQIDALESLRTSADIMDVMQEANQALKGANCNLDFNNIISLMDDTADQLEITREINNALANPVGMGQELPEEDLAKELDEIVEEKGHRPRKSSRRKRPGLMSRQNSRISHEALKIDALPEVPQGDLSDLEAKIQSQFDKSEKEAKNKEVRFATNAS